MAAAVLVATVFRETHTIVGSDSHHSRGNCAAVAVEVADIEMRIKSSQYVGLSRTSILTTWEFAAVIKPAIEYLYSMEVWTDVRRFVAASRSGRTERQTTKANQSDR